MCKRLAILATLTLLGGCGGKKVITVPQNVAPAGGDFPAVVRLERYEFAFVKLPVKNGSIRFQVAQAPVRAAYTDKKGYAAACVPVPAEPGCYGLHVQHQGADGDERAVIAAVHVWKADEKIVAVDADHLPTGGARSAPAVAAVEALSAQGRVLYLSRCDIDRQTALNRRLCGAGYPNGPIIAWSGSASKASAELAGLRKTFPNFKMGLTADDDAARAMACALEWVVTVGPSQPKLGSQATHTHHASWDDLGAKITASQAAR